MPNPDYLTQRILIEPLEENFPDDPYSTVTFAIRNLIYRALHYHTGTMNETEAANLVAFEEFLRQRDNA